MADPLYIGGVDQDDQRCLRCGSWYLDTGWECNDCGYDNMPHYCPPEIIAGMENPT
jgi:hypothetical protein